jgi:hypothetical protein
MMPLCKLYEAKRHMPKNNPKQSVFLSIKRYVSDCAEKNKQPDKRIDALAVALEGLDSTEEIALAVYEVYKKTDESLRFYLALSLKYMLDIEVKPSIWGDASESAIEKAINNLKKPPEEKALIRRYL